MWSGCATPHDLDRDDDGYYESDCNDALASIHPYADEACNGLDDDCDGQVDERVTAPWFMDADGDGFGDALTGVPGCGPTAGRVPNGFDCDDSRPEIHPGAPDPCDGVDESCSGNAREEDGDADGFSECEGDCDDLTATRYPGAPETCDGLDDDCDGALPGDEVDGDEDGDLACIDCDDTRRDQASRNFEVCDGADNNCSGVVDEDCVDCDVAVPNDQDAIQAGIDVAATGDVVCVGPGTWPESLDFHGATITLLGVAGRDATVISHLDDDGTAVVFQSAETSATQMIGFTVASYAAWDEGIAIHDASPTLADLEVRDFDAAGIVVDGADVSMSNLLIRDNFGGGVSFDGAFATLENVVIEGNYAYASGGGIRATASTLVVNHALITDNDTNDCGGGVYLESSVVTLTDVILTYNSGWCGAAIDGPAIVLNALIEHNWSRGDSGAVYSESPAATLTNAVVVGNFSYYSDAGAAVVGDVSLSYSDVYGNYPNNFSGADPTGTDGNLSIDPLLYDSLGHLGSASPLIDAGDPAISDADGGSSDIGPFGGPGGHEWDLDGDGYFSWWLPGAYDPATSPGLDCDDLDAGAYPGEGC